MIIDRLIIFFMGATGSILIVIDLFVIYILMKGDKK